LAGVRWRRDKPPRGVAAVELAVLLPLLLLLSISAIDCGRFAYVYIALSNAVRIAAEQGATQTMSSYNKSSWQSAMQSAATQEMSGVPNMSSAEITLTITTTATSYGLLQVTVNGQYPFTPILSWPGVGQTVMLDRTLCVRQFR
jgi:Flp pilus assembly protein TadG